MVHGLSNVTSNVADEVGCGFVSTYGEDATASIVTTCFYGFGLTGDRSALYSIVNSLSVRDIAVLGVLLASLNLDILYW